MGQGRAPGPRGLGAVASLPPYASCYHQGVDYEYSSEDGWCHKLASSSLPSGPTHPDRISPSCDNGGVWIADTGVCDRMGMGDEGAPDLIPSGAVPHPENAVQAKACLEAGGSWSDTPPACHGAHVASDVTTPVLPSSPVKTVALVVATLGFLVGGGYLLYRSQQK